MREEELEQAAEEKQESTAEPVGAVVREAVLVSASPTHQLARERRESHDKSSQGPAISRLLVPPIAISSKTPKNAQWGWVSPVLLGRLGCGPGLDDDLCQLGGVVVGVVRHGGRILRRNRPAGEQKERQAERDGVTRRETGISEVASWCLCSKGSPLSRRVARKVPSLRLTWLLSSVRDRVARRLSTDSTVGTGVARIHPYCRRVRMNIHGCLNPAKEGHHFEKQHDERCKGNISTST